MVAVGSLAVVGSLQLRHDRELSEGSMLHLAGLGLQVLRRAAWPHDSPNDSNKDR